MGVLLGAVEELGSTEVVEPALGEAPSLPPGLAPTTRSAAPRLVGEGEEEGVGLGLEVGEGLGTGLGLGLAVGAGRTVGLELAVGAGRTVGAGLTVGMGFGLAAGLGLGVMVMGLGGGTPGGGEGTGKVGAHSWLMLAYVAARNGARV
jgi:hypothetical protein